MTPLEQAREALKAARAALETGRINAVSEWEVREITPRIVTEAIRDVDAALASLEAAEPQFVFCRHCGHKVTSRECSAEESKNCTAMHIPREAAGGGVEPTLSNARILHLWDTHVAYETNVNRPQQPPLTNKDKLAFARAVLSASPSVPAEGVQRDALRAGVRQIVAALRNREWADLLTTDPDLADLETEVGKLIGARDA